MDLRYTDEELAFRDEVRAFFKEVLPDDIRRKAVLGQRYSANDLRRWQRILYERGWATPAWDRAWGGTGWSAVQQYIFKEELHMAPAPEPLSFNVNMIGPVLIAFGSDEQKRDFLPRIASLEYWFCQGFSEPGAGSDLAALRTQAVHEGDHYVINGQKLWTSTAHHADWMFCLVRTDASAKKQQGITYLLIDMKTPGLTVRPIITIDGYHETNEVFFDNVRVPVANRIGEENKGWDYAKFLLGNERSGIARVGVSKMRIRHAKDLAKRVPSGDGVLWDDLQFRERVVAIEVELKALEITQMRVIAESSARGSHVPDPKTSILKIKGSELQQLAAELLLEVAGPDALPLDLDFLRGLGEPLREPDWALTIAPNHYFARHVSIVGGSNEIQKNILAKSVLGL
ncbi:alkylation response protein AidB-like acyl-CoA dehydrogenase [Paraburkholderia sp. BL23I1N1]|uniref:acyl-CoA dehydrogenase family protein n=1 Tax=Paraburkholderia sp. BL23I1N1 TaxID=1938802 RepID=UPI000E75C981|nr:acyl-CoA dehydrogenase family protein [Paraburkholderia sp. BL23I1N1]RKE39164.1 alkylation response protein AidB-like acyl-CoA dehydrogenase [Paraburkholderia sp. BL23I1N1]